MGIQSLRKSLSENSISDLLKGRKPLREFSLESMPSLPIVGAQYQPAYSKFTNASIGKMVHCIAEPENAHDENAVACYMAFPAKDPAKEYLWEKVGYLPKGSTEYFRAFCDKANIPYVNASMTGVTTPHRYIRFSGNTGRMATIDR